MTLCSVGLMPLFGSGPALAPCRAPFVHTPRKSGDAGLIGQLAEKKMRATGRMRQEKSSLVLEESARECGAQNELPLV
jgi:hypothetical protein